MKRTFAALAAVVLLTSGFTSAQSSPVQTDVPRWMCNMFFWMPCSS
ncbi:MAG: hypothetical protein ACLGHZ_03165 [Actinomycetes bacterium]